MGVLKTVLGTVAGFALLETVYAGLDLSSNSTVVVYWGQNSFSGTGDLAQQRLGYYCDDSNIDVIVMAFLMTINGPGGAPEIDFATTSEKCDVFEGTNLKNCPEIGEDITKCQSKGKTILLSIGGATYSEGGFDSQTAADSGADLIWSTFGPDKGDNKTHRPFGKAVVDGFDFDFEAAVSNTGVFAEKLRSLADEDTSKKYFLTAAPQCPFPDAADKDILNTDSSAAIDAVFVQFYNNYCGVNAYTPARKAKTHTNTKPSSSKDGKKEKHSRGLVGTPHRAAAQNAFNFDVWDKWALTESKNPNVRVFLGVPANTGAASTGYLPAASLAPVISYSKGFESFGGVMMWDVSQAYGNKGFLSGVKNALVGETHGKAEEAQDEGSEGGEKPQEEEEEEEEEESAPSPSPSPSASACASPSPVTKPPQETEEQDESDSADSADSDADSDASDSEQGTTATSTTTTNTPQQTNAPLQGSKPSSTGQPDDQPSQSSTSESQTSSTSTAETTQSQSSASTGEQPQNQDSGDDQDEDAEEPEEEEEEEQPDLLSSLSSIMDAVDLHFI